MATSYPHFLQHVNLLLVGKTGNGKSSTGNSILGRKVFVSKNSTTSVTFEPKLETSLIDGQTISVTDVPGLSDTQFDKEENVVKARDWINKAIRLSRGGFHAIVLVIRFGNRFTEEDRESIEVLKSILGNRVIQDHSVCAITYGDALRWDIDNGEIGSFKEWCSEQSGAFLDLLNESGQRCVLFDNVSKDGSVQKSQRNELIQDVMKLQDGGLRTYGVHELEKATRSQQIRSPSLNLMTTSKIPMARSSFANPHENFGNIRHTFFQQKERDDSDETEEETSTSEDEDDSEGNRVDTFGDLNQFLYQRKLRTWMYRNQPSEDGDSDDSSAESHNDDDSDKNDDGDKDDDGDKNDDGDNDDSSDDSDDDIDDDVDNGVEEEEEEQDDSDEDSPEVNVVNDQVADLARYVQRYPRDENQECRLL